MSRSRFILLSIAAASVVIAVVVRSSAGPAGDAPVVLELFTSQGCSSCPPADELLRKIASDASLRGRVIPLAYHVDYWNHLGWRDPFSAHEWSERQGGYVRAMRLESAYTPQMIVDGTQQMVGSSTYNVTRAIESESNRKIVGSVALRSATDGVHVHAESPRGDVDVIVVVFEDAATTKVGAGENGGRTLSEAAIVRSLMRAGTLDGHKALDRDVPLELTSKSGVAVFLQDRKTLHIDAAAVLR
jgi:hypothetical protein